jgi:formylglycine-generating enzyme required for sulfatase activity
MRIFISYAHVDWQFVKNLAERLRRYHDVWYDDRLHAGQDWWQTILQRLDWCECFIYVLTPESLTSKYCLKEYEEAERLERCIVPVRMQSNITLPDDLGRIQYADFADVLFDVALADLIGDLGQIALNLKGQPAQPDQHALPPTPAPQPASAPGKPFDPAEVFRQAGEAQGAGEYEAALRLLNTLRQDAPDYLPDYVAIQAADVERALKQQAQRKEYLRVYEQISLLAQGKQTVDAARQLMGRLREDYPDIAHDPEDFAERFFGVTGVLPPPFEWIEIPAGQVTIEEGIEESSIPEGYRGTYLLERFMIAKYPVTGAQYQVFVDAEDGYRDALWWTYSEQVQQLRSNNPRLLEPVRGGLPDHPRVNVNWFEAVAFCCWLSERVGYRVRLPTEQEWQRAAQGDDGRTYPWGNQEPERADSDTNVGPTVPVGSHPEWASPYGVLDMVGNVWEWCLTDYETGQNDIGQAADIRVMRGSPWRADRQVTSCTSRAVASSGSRNKDLGFRLARSC